MEYRIGADATRLLAVGLYRQVGEFVSAMKRDNPSDFEQFKADYLAKQAVQVPAPVKRRHSRNRPTASR